MTHVADLLAAARAKGVMIATAESCTGGMVAAALTDIPGSSAMFDRGFVTYTNAAKMQMLAVSAQLLDKYGAVSEPVARAMAQGALGHSQAQIAVAITGIAGPGGSDHKAEGMVCFAVATDDHVTIKTVQYGALGRDNVRQAAVQEALALLQSGIDSLSPQN